MESKTEILIEIKEVRELIMDMCKRLDDIEENTDRNSRVAEFWTSLSLPFIRLLPQYIVGNNEISNTYKKENDQPNIRRLLLSRLS